MTDLPAPINLQAMILCSAAVNDPFTNRWSVIGIFEKCILASFPATVPPFAVYLAFSEMRPDILLNLHVLNDEGEVIFAGNEVNLGRQRPDTLVECGVVLRGVKVDKPGFYTVRLTANRLFVAERRLFVLSTSS